MSETNEQEATAKSYLLAVGVLFIAVMGISTFFVVGYTRGIPREAFLLFGRHLSLVIGLETSFSVAFSLITAKVILVLVSVPVSLVGSVLSGFKNENLKRAAAKADDIAIKIVVAPLRTVLLLAVSVYWMTFFHFSIESLMLIGGWIVLGETLLAATDRDFLQKKSKENTNSKTEIENYESVRLLIIATLISGCAYSAGIASERQTKRKEARILSEKLERPGIVFGAEDIGLLVYVPRELLETQAGNFQERREPSAWYLLPFNGDPLELR